VGATGTPLPATADVAPDLVDLALQAPHPAGKMAPSKSQAARDLPMLRIFWALLLQACLFAGSPAWAQDRGAAAEDLLRKSGLWEQLGDVESQLLAGFAEGLSRSRPKLSEAESDRLAKVIRASYQASRLRAVAKRVLAEGLAEEHVGALRSWFDSPAGAAIVRLEEQASAEHRDPGESVARGNAVLESSTPRRRELLDDFVRSSKMPEAAVELVLGTALGIQRGVMAATPDAPGMTAAELKAALASQRPQLLNIYSKVLTATSAQLYQPLSDAELERYAAFMKSPAGQHFTILVIRALDTAMSEAAEDLGRHLPGTKDRANS
jgi:hypothetical protein